VFGTTGLTLAAVADAPSSLFAWLLVGGALGATVSGCQATLYGLAPSCYPTSVRGTGVGVSVSVGRFGSAAGPLVGGQLLAAGLSSNQIMLAMLPVVAVAGIAAAFLSLRPAIDH
jgi:AAHS family 3-hydroxyphenylpropionic acid transporter